MSGTVLHHVQVACPRGGEDGARRFWVQGLGLTEVDKPEALRARGGIWVRSIAGDGSVGAEVHVGVEEPFVPARKAHPALLLSDVTALEAAGERLRGLGFDVDAGEWETFGGYLRLHVHDTHGNRVELLSDRVLMPDDDGKEMPHPVTSALGHPLGGRAAGGWSISS